MSCREVVTRHLRIFVSDGRVNERKEIRRSRIKSGMTPLFNNNAFTLIELLVVVLIIGILAAVALPKYQRAVDKSRFVQVQTFFRTVWQAQQVFFLANGRYAYNWDELAADLPPTTSGGGESNYAYWDWGYCALFGEYGICGLQQNNSTNTRLLQYWNSPNARCFAAKTSTRAQEICRAVTGKNQSQATLSGGNYFYNFN